MAQRRAPHACFARACRVGPRRCTGLGGRRRRRPRAVPIPSWSASAKRRAASAKGRAPRSKPGVTAPRRRWTAAKTDVVCRPPPVEPRKGRVWIFEGEPQRDPFTCLAPSYPRPVSRAPRPTWARSVSAGAPLKGIAGRARRCSPPGSKNIFAAVSIPTSSLVAPARSRRPGLRRRYQRERSRRRGARSSRDPRRRGRRIHRRLSRAPPA